MNVETALSKIVDKQSLTQEEARTVMDGIMSGGATDAQIGALLTALRMKGETVEEITGFACAMRSKVAAVHVDEPILLDTCGTGGDGAGTFNVSTTVAIVAAGAGVKVAKHGNRSITSSSGGADVLQALGVNIDIPADQVAACIRETGMGFLFAPRLHPAMKHAIGPRREMKIRTVFNILGPITNPAGAQYQLMGVFHPGLTRILAQVLGNLGAKHAIVVCGPGGMDEAATWGESSVAQWDGRAVHCWTLNPADHGLPRGTPSDITVGSPAESAALIHEVLRAEKGTARDVVVLNAALAFLACGKVSDLAAGMRLAEDTLDQHKAGNMLEALIRFTNH